MYLDHQGTSESIIVPNFSASGNIIISKKYVDTMLLKLFSFNFKKLFALEGSIHQAETLHNNLPSEG